MLPRPRPLRWLRRKVTALVLLAVVGVPAAGVATGTISHVGPWDVSQYSASALYDSLTGSVLDAMVPGQDGRVVRVVDGDTLVVRVAGKSERIRVLGINTPETKKPGTPVECFGPQATKNAKRWVNARRDRVTLTIDVAASDRDRYGRLLRYVEPRGTGRDLSSEQVSSGFAEVASYGQQLRRLGALERAERAAKRANRGRWGAC